MKENKSDMQYQMKTTEYRLLTWDIQNMMGVKLAKPNWGGV